MKKFRTRGLDSVIEPVDVVRETSAFVMLPPWREGGKERREAKTGDYVQYHDTWEAAHASLLGRAQRNVSWTQKRLEIETEALDKIKGMKKPADT